MKSAQADDGNHPGQTHRSRAGLISRDAWIVFLISLVVRLVLAFGMGEVFDESSDTKRYVELSERVLAGSFDFEKPEFIVSPLYPVFLASIRLVAGGQWILAMELAQSFLSALETVLLYRIAMLLWNRKRVSWLAALGHAFYPLNLSYVSQVGQESLFEFLWVACIFWLIVSGRRRNYGSVIASAVFFGLGYLTKSHILLYAPFVCVHYLLNGDSISDSVRKIALFGAISFAISIPWGIYNWQTKNAYILSSSGYGSHFLGAHHDEYYDFLTKPPVLRSDEWYRAMAWWKHDVFREVFAKRTESGMSDREFQRMCYEYGLKWCRENPDKYYWLKVTDLGRLVRPGISRHHYRFEIWLASALICTPVFLMAYAGIAWNLRADFRRHFWILGIILMMAIYVVSFYYQGRFRVITIEEFYLVYAAFSADRFLSWLSKRNAIVEA